VINWGLYSPYSRYLILALLAFAGVKASPTAHREAETAKAHRG